MPWQAEKQFSAAIPSGAESPAIARRFSVNSDVLVSHFIPGRRWRVRLSPSRSIGHDRSQWQYLKSAIKHRNIHHFPRWERRRGFAFVTPTLFHGLGDFAGFRYRGHFIRDGYVGGGHAMRAKRGDASRRFRRHVMRNGVYADDVAIDQYRVDAESSHGDTNGRATSAGRRRRPWKHAASSGAIGGAARLSRHHIAASRRSQISWRRLISIYVRRNAAASRAMMIKREISYRSSAARISRRYYRVMLPLARHINVIGQ